MLPHDSVTRAARRHCEVCQTFQPDETGRCPMCATESPGRSGDVVDDLVAQRGARLGQRDGAA